MNLNQLDYFIQVSESGSFSRAAAKNFISPQGISANIIRLEEELHTKLFERTASGVQLTKDGKYLYQKGKDILSLVQDCENYFKQQNNGKQIITLYYTPEFASALPHAFLSMIIEKYCLDIHTVGSIACEERVLSGDGQYAFTNGPYFNKNLIYEYCFTRNQCLIAHRDNPLASKTGLRLADLKDSRFIMPDQNYKMNWVFRDKCRKAGFDPDIAFTTPSFSTIHTLLKQYRTWIGYSFDFYMEQNIDSEIVTLEVEDLVWPWDVYFVRAKGSKDEPSSFTKDVVHFFRDYNRDIPSARPGGVGSGE